MREERTEGQKRIIADNPDLQVVSSENWNTLKVASSNLKKELKKAFPETKFSVRAKSFSGGDDIHVSWVAGPTADVVEAVANKYQEGNFNGMEDIYEYNQDKTWTKIFGGAKYVFCNREHSCETYYKTAKEVAKEFDVVFNLTWHVSSWRGYESKSLYVENGDDIDISNHSRDQYVSRAINQKYSKTDYRDKDVETEKAEIARVIDDVKDGHKVVVG